jgi:broad specificity phosphatase PhoE
VIAAHRIHKQAGRSRLVLFWATVFSAVLWGFSLSFSLASSSQAEAATSAPPASAASAAQAKADDIAEQERLWALLAKGGHVVLIRHAATVPGIGDPANFSLDNCATQRNLSDAGRDEARRMGAEFAKRKIPVGRVLSSPWCRCVDTAKLAFGSAEVWEPLSSSFRNTAKSAEMAESVKRRISRFGVDLSKPGAPRGNLVLVTHQFNINDVTGKSVGMGEMVVARPDGCCGVKVLGVISVATGG